MALEYPAHRSKVKERAYTMTEVQAALLDEWIGRMRSAQKAHYNMTSHHRRWYLLIGLPIVILSGTSAFLAFGLPILPIKNSSMWAGFVSMFVAILAGVQTFLRHNEQADKHVVAAKNYSDLKNELEQLRAFPPLEDELDRTLCAVRGRWQQINNAAPEAPSSLWRVGSPKERQ